MDDDNIVDSAPPEVWAEIDQELDDEAQQWVEATAQAMQDDVSSED